MRRWLDWIPQERFGLWLLSKPRYWRLRHLAASLLFRARRGTFGMFRYVGVARDAGSVLWAFARGAVPSIIQAVGGIALVEVAATLSRQHSSLLVVANQAQRDSYQALLLTIAGVGGTLLGLYFTALTVVLSGSYVDASYDVRHLIVHERAGNLYTRLVTAAVVGALVVVGADVVGWRPSGLSVLVITGVAILASVCLLIVGTRAFGFFDPAALGQVLHHEFIRWAHQAKNRGFAVRDPSFQFYYHRKGAQCLSTLDHLAHLVSKKRSPNGSEIERLLADVLGLWNSYSSCKVAIPVDSRWFRRRYEHRDWLRESGSSLDIALATDTHLPPREVGEPHWVEADLAEILTRLCSDLTGPSEVDSLAMFLSKANALLEALGRRLQMQEARLLWRAVSTACWSGVNRIQKGSTNNADLKLLMLTSDMVSLLPISIVVGVATRLRDFDVDDVSDAVRTVVIAGRRGMVRGPAELNRNLDWLASGVAFECAVEGVRISPAWWLREEAARSMADLLCSIFPSILDGLEAESERHSSSWSAWPIAGAVVRFRTLELLRKISRHADGVGTVIEQLALHRKLTGEPWPALNGKALRARTHDLRAQVIVALASCVPHLPSGFGATQDEPDLLGRAHALLIRETFRAIVRGDSEFVARVFPPTFLCGLQAYERLRKCVDPDDPRQSTANAIYMSEAVVDLLELSGYALLCMEMGDKTMWDAVEVTWAKHIAGHPEMCLLVGRLLSFRDDQFGILPRGAARIGREREFWEAKMGDDSPGMVVSRSRRQSHHANPTVEVMRGASSMYSAEDLFFSEFLVSKGDFPEGQLPEKTRRLREALRREQERRRGQP